MDEFEKQVLLDFIEERWADFEQFCESREEGLAEKIHKELGGEDE